MTRPITPRQQGILSRASKWTYDGKPMGMGWGSLEDTDHASARGLIKRGLLRLSDSGILYPTCEGWEKVASDYKAAGNFDGATSARGCIKHERLAA